VSCSEQQQKILLNIEDVARRLGVTVSTVHGLTRSRGRDRTNPIPFLKIGKRVYFRNESIEKWLAAKESETCRL
jgi:excisionase family DNA binding protein